MKLVRVKYTPIRMFPWATSWRSIAAARKRCILKRVLIANGIAGWERDWPTERLQFLVRDLRDQEHHRFPSHYIRQLAAVKAIWGPQSGIGVLCDDGSSRQCYTIADLIDVGFISPKLLYLEAKLSRIRRMGT